jgi:hypothetical protein
MPENKIMTKHRAMPANKKIFLIILIIIYFMEDPGKKLDSALSLVFLERDIET